MLRSLLVQNVRIIEQLEISLASDVNLFVGENGAGKTSILEAIDVLSRGRSFRERRIKPLIRNHVHELIVSCTLLTASGNFDLGIKKTAQKTVLHCNQERVGSISSHASRLPVVSMHPDSHQLVQGGARQRRRYLDWSTFHVKQTFLSTWRDYNQCLKQRNHALREQCSKQEMQVWTQQLSRLARKVDQERSLIFEELNPYIDEYSRSLLPECKLRVAYHRGWPAEQELEQALLEVQEQESRRKTTVLGAHRANLQLFLDQQEAATVASRGQQKLIATSLLLAQIDHLQQHSGQKCIVLFDDVYAELDQKHAKAPVVALQKLGCQVFITAVDGQQVDLHGWHDTRVFHVKQGVCAPLANADP